MLVATSNTTFGQMAQHLHEKKWYKEYMALMHGALPPKRSQGVLNYRLYTKSENGRGWRTEVNAKKVQVSKYSKVP